MSAPLPQLTHALAQNRHGFTTSEQLKSFFSASFPTRGLGSLAPCLSVFWRHEWKEGNSLKQDKLDLRHTSHSADITGTKGDRHVDVLPGVTHSTLSLSHYLEISTECMYQSNRSRCLLQALKPEILTARNLRSDPSCIRRRDGSRQCRGPALQRCSHLTGLCRRRLGIRRRTPTPPHVDKPAA